MATIETMKRRTAVLEERKNPEVNTWMDFMIAVKEGREIVLGASMAGLLQGGVIDEH